MLRIRLFLHPVCQTKDPYLSPCVDAEKMHLLSIVMGSDWRCLSGIQAGLGDELPRDGHLDTQTKKLLYTDEPAPALQSLLVIGEIRPR